MEYNSRDFNGRSKCKIVIQFKNMEIPRDLKREQREEMMLLEFRKSWSPARRRHPRGCVARQRHSLCRECSPKQGGSGWEVTWHDLTLAKFNQKPAGQGALGAVQRQRMYLGKEANRITSTYIQINTFNKYKTNNKTNTFIKNTFLYEWYATNQELSMYIKG